MLGQVWPLLGHSLKLNEVQSDLAESTHKVVNYHSKGITQKQQQRSELSPITLTWHVSNTRWINSTRCIYLNARWEFICCRWLCCVCVMPFRHLLDQVWHLSDQVWQSLGQLWHLTVFSTSSPANHDWWMSDSKLKIKSTRHFKNHNSQFWVCISVSSTCWRKTSLLGESTFWGSQHL